MTDPQRILVAGGQGRLGKALGALGCTAPGRDRLDITDAAKTASVIEQTMPGVIINTAGFTNVDAAEAEPELARRINADGAGLLARLAAVSGIPLIHVSTDLVFSKGDPSKPIREKAATAPVSVYGETKLEGEIQVRAAGGRHLVTRVSWLFGNDSMSFVAKILKLGREHETLRLVTDEYGRPTPFDALARQLVTLAGMMSGGRDLPSVLHLGSPGPVNRLEWAEQIFAVSEKLGGPAPKMEPVLGSAFKTLARRANGVVLDTSHADQLIGPMPDWRPACDASVKALLDA